MIHPRSIPADGVRSRRAVQGISLLEVLVSVVVLSIGLLGVAAMQSVALRGGQSSLESSQATIQTTAIIEAMRANPAAGAAYNVGMTCAVPAGGTQAQNDVRDWISSLKSTIGNGPVLDTTTCGSIANCPATCTITVQWDDTRSGGGNQRRMTTVTRI
jgi:type IV pilus assembly protein PilV